MIKPEFTEQEAQALIELIDAGVKANGLSSARAAVAVTEKIFAAVEASKEENTTTKKETK